MSSMPFPVPLDDLASFVPAFNANGPVNAIPYVCAAPPGILTTEDLPHILPRGPRRTVPHTASTSWSMRTTTPGR